MSRSFGKLKAIFSSQMTDIAEQDGTTSGGGVEPAEPAQPRLVNLAMLKARFSRSADEFESAVEDIIAKRVDEDNQYSTYIRPLIYCGVGYGIAHLMMSMCDIRPSIVLPAVSVGMVVGHYKLSLLKKVNRTVLIGAGVAAIAVLVATKMKDKSIPPKTHWTSTCY